MKSFTSLKSFAIIATLTLFLVSCSNQRYGNIQRGTIKAKEIAKVEKTTPTTTQTIDALVASNPTLAAVTTTPDIFTSFNAVKAVKAVEVTSVKEKISKKIISKMFNTLVSPAVEAKAPYTVATASNQSGTNNHAIEKALLILLAILIPPVAVGLVSDWSDTSAIIINLILTILCWIPGIIHAFIYIKKNN